MRRFVLLFTLLGLYAFGWTVGAQSPPDDPAAPDFVAHMTRADFDRLARTTVQGKQAATPSVM
ncbi:MAG: hypothetical protein RML57_11000, partial [Acidobacteriota bacterium]|nr:hypothetical protein [Acidobacteriota bacterium]